MRTLAVDLGSRRVGLAVSDEGGKFATPYDVLTVGSSDDALAPIAELIAREGVDRVIVGLPLNMDDTAGPAATAAMQWGQKLQDRCGISVTFVDERLSSFEAEHRLSERKRAGEKITRGQKKRMLDAHAAATILQEFLDGKLPAIAATDPQGKQISKKEDDRGSRRSHG
ncbi:MAG TPA: Holliday junction resolvase RuvX [Tepidisphaeraceae bacterium]|jgi:putative Holliday junction resolvase|nr:Holliday junction resolvase RuvX [Tepidisphaeraceae bacterium]